MPVKLLLDMAFRYALGRFGSAGRSGGHATGASFVGTLALAGLVVSIAVLVFVISVVNGFEREMRERLLNVLPHITATSTQGMPLADIANLPAPDVRSGLTALAPVTQSSGLLAANGQVRPVQITGVDDSYGKVSAVAEFAIDGAFADLQRTAFGIALGGRLADQLEVGVGDDLVVLLPDQRISIAGALPRQKRFTVVSVFRSQSQLDTSGAFIALADAQRLLRMPGRAHGVQGRLTELFNSYGASQFLYSQLATSTPRVRSWMTEFGTLYQAISVQKATLFLLFSLLIAVAAFNLVSGLIMIVEQRRSDIAILRSMGTSRVRVLGLFCLVGTVLGVVGTVVGITVGLLLGLGVPPLVNAVTASLQYDLMSQYFIGYLPVQVLFEDLLFIAGLSVGAALLASLYPAWRAMGLMPSRVLANE
jgi:lipoprotein-releasing system permease protein